jgi:beta-lactamase class D
MVPEVKALFFLLLLAIPARADVFSDAKYDGAFVLLDVKADRMTILHPALAQTRFLPASTYKIPNTLIGLTTGVITGESFALKWDGVKRELPDWNRDHDLPSAMKFSVLWFYQEVARRVGHERMKKLVDGFGYGSRDIGPKEKVDTFWIDATLRITPVEQVEFLRKMIAGELPVKPEHVALVEKITILETGDGWVWRGKTGMGWQDQRRVGWLIGSVQKRDARYVYALLLLGKTAEGPERMRDLRKTLARQLLVAHGVLP